METGTVVYDQEPNFTAPGKVSRHEFSWTADASGNVEKELLPLSGTILCAQIKGDTDNAPTLGFDVTLTDGLGVDVLAGQGADMAATDAKTVVPMVEATDGTTATVLPRAIADRLTLAIAGAGAGKSGKLVLYIR